MSWWSVGDVSVNWTGESPRFSLRARTYRGTGIEHLRASSDLRAFLVGICQVAELRKLVLESLLRAEEISAQSADADATQFKDDDALLWNWLKTLDADGLYAVLHHHPLGPGRHSYWSTWDVEDRAYARALKSLPRGIGRARLELVLDRWREAVSGLGR